MADDSGVELLRKSWEIEDHWVLRRDFMLAHKDRFPPERLLCLAQIFVNIETLGVQYDEEVMNEMTQLSDEVQSLTEFRQKKVQLQSEERFKAPPKNKNEVGTRNVTHDRYQNHQQNYAQGRQDYAQYQQTHGYGKAQHHSYPGQGYGQGYNAQPAPHHQQQQRYHQPNYQRQQYSANQRQQPYQQQSQPQYQTPVYGRNAASGSHHPGHPGGGQAYGRDGRGRSNQQSGPSSSYQNLLSRGNRR